MDYLSIEPFITSAAEISFSSGNLCVSRLSRLRRNRSDDENKVMLRLKWYFIWTRQGLTSNVTRAAGIMSIKVKAESLAAMSLL